MPLRNEYVRDRIGQRMQSRGEQLLLRRISLRAGPQPYPNPPNVSADLVVDAVSTHSGQVYLHISGGTVIGRLIAGDKLTVLSTVLTVVTMPASVMTDSDGIPVVDGSDHPIFGSPPVYVADTLAWNNEFPVVPVAGIVDPTPLLNQPVSSFTFVNDQVAYGNPLTFEKMTALGWVEVDRVGYAIAARGLSSAPKVNDQIILVQSGGQKRAIMQVGPRFSNGVDFLYNVQAQ